MTASPWRFPPPDPELEPLARRDLSFLVRAAQAGRPLDRFLADIGGLSLARVRALIDFGSVWVDGKVCQRAERELVPGARVVLCVPAYGPVRFYEVTESRILFEDRWVLAYDKEAGIPSQQTPYDGYNHLFGALRRRLAKGRGAGYLALHHRLDGPTSGVMVFAKDKRANLALGRAFADGSLEKTYLAVVAGWPAMDHWSENRPIAKGRGAYFCPPDGNGKPALTHFSVLARSGSGTDRQTLVLARPATGRTHQIRLHLSAGGFPVVGDPAHGGPTAQRLMLHAQRLKLTHPVTGRPLDLEAPAPEGFSFA